MSFWGASSNTNKRIINKYASLTHLNLHRSSILCEYEFQNEMTVSHVKQKGMNNCHMVVDFNKIEKST